MVLFSIRKSLQLPNMNVLFKIKTSKSLPNLRLACLVLGIAFSFTVSDLVGQDIKVIKYPDLEKIIAEKSDKTKIINFWATWCGPCIKELPQFEDLNTKYNNNVEVFLVSFDFVEQLAKAKNFASKKNLKSNLYLLDETDYNAFIDKVDPSWSGAIPATLMISQDKRAFYEKEFKEGELEKTYTQFIN